MSGVCTTAKAYLERPPKKYRKAHRKAHRIPYRNRAHSNNEAFEGVANASGTLEMEYSLSCSTNLCTDSTPSERVAALLPDADLCAIVCDPFADPSAYVGLIIRNLISRSIPVVLLTSSFKRISTFKRLNVEMRRSDIILYKTFLDLKRGFLRDLEISDCVVIIDCFVSAPFDATRSLVSGLLQRARATLLTFCFPIGSPLVSILANTDRYILPPLARDTSIIQSIADRHILLHHRGHRRIRARIMRPSVQTNTADPLEERLKGIFSEVSRMLSEYPTVVLITQEKLEKVCQVLLELPRVRVCRIGKNIDPLRHNGRIWVMSHRQSLKYIAHLHVRTGVVLLDLPKNSSHWIQQNFSTVEGSPPLCLVMSGTLQEQSRMYNLNHELHTLLLSSRELSQVTRIADLLFPMAFTPQIVQTLRFIVFIRCLSLKYASMSDVAQQTTIHTPVTAAAGMLAILHRYARTSFIMERKPFRALCLLSVCISVEPSLSRWLRDDSAKCVPDSVLVACLGRVPPSEIVAKICSFISTAPLDALDMIGHAGRMLVDGFNTKSFFKAAQKLPPYMQTQLIEAYPYARNFSTRYLQD